MNNQYKYIIDKIEFKADYREKLMDTVTSYTKNKNHRKLERTKVGKILIKREIRKTAFLFAILLIVFVGLSTKPIQAALKIVFSFGTDGINHNYETNMSSYKDEVNQSVTVDGFTMNIYDIVMANQGMMIRYNLVDENGNAVTTQFQDKAVAYHSMGTVHISDHKKRTIVGRVEYHEQTFSEDDLSPFLALITFDDPNVNTKEWINCPIEISIKMAWTDGDCNPIIKSFSFYYTPTKIYEEQLININQKLIGDTITVRKLTLNGLYTKVEAEYRTDFDKKDNFFLKAVDESGNEINRYEIRTENTEGSNIVYATYIFENVNENVSKIYLIPCYDEINENDIWNTIQLDEKLEIEIPK